jgi:hypothetical protein
MMRIFRFLNVAILSLMLGSAVFVHAQDEKPQDDKPAQPEEAKPLPKQDAAKPAQQDEAKPSKQEEKQEQKQEKQDEKQSHDQAMPDHQDHPGQPAAHEQGNPEHPEQGQAHAMPAGKGGHIPDDKFRAHFGRSHTFTASTVIVSGQPQFQYGGYSFQLVNAWPVGWAYTDSCYIDYIDGEYFLFDLLHPGVQVAVVVVM